MAWALPPFPRIGWPGGGWGNNIVRVKNGLVIALAALAAARLANCKLDRNGVAGKNTAVDNWDMESVL